MTLVNQPSAMPSRKLWAVIVTTFVVQGGIGVAEYFLPGITEAVPAAEWIAMLVPVVSGYMVRERTQ